MKPGDAIDVIVGPTASGKTALALSWAKDDPTIEIVNADASALYRGFDIGTAKPTPEERQTVPHHLIDVLDPNERFSAGEYSMVARNVIREIIARDKRPVVVGGTGLYIDALFVGIIPSTASEEAVQAARERVATEMKKHSFDELHVRLAPIDPLLYKQIQRERNPIRLARAWEHYYATGEPLGLARQQKPEPFEYAPRYTVLMPERTELWKRIEARTDQLLANGWIEEVKGLLEKGVSPDAPAMRAIGYKEIVRYLSGELPPEELREKIVIATRQYAKRQVTWMKRYLE